MGKSGRILGFCSITWAEPVVSQEQVAVGLQDVTEFEGGGLVEFGAVEYPGRAAGDELGCQGQAEFVEQSGGGELGADSRASLDEHVADIAVGQVLQGNPEIRRLCRRQ